MVDHLAALRLEVNLHQAPLLRLDLEGYQTADAEALETMVAEGLGLAEDTFRAMRPMLQGVQAPTGQKLLLQAAYSRAW